MQRSILLLFVFIVAVTACRKGTAPEEFYFGKVNVSQASISDAAPLDIYFGDEKIGTVATSGVPSMFTVPAGKQGKLSIYKSATDTLVADTTISIAANGAMDLKVIYSELLGIKGFLENNTGTATDSLKFQFMFSFKSSFYKDYTELDIQLLQGFAREDLGVVVKGLKPGVLSSQVITLPHFKDGDYLPYYFMLKDSKTGEYVTQKLLDRNLFLLIGSAPDYGGHLNIVQITDDEGDETSNRIIANVSIL